MVVCKQSLDSGLILDQGPLQLGTPPAAPSSPSFKYILYHMYQIVCHCWSVRGTSAGRGIPLLGLLLRLHPFFFPVKTIIWVFFLTGIEGLRTEGLVLTGCKAHRGVRICDSGLYKYILLDFLHSYQSYIVRHNPPKAEHLKCSMSCM